MRLRSSFDRKVAKDARTQAIVAEEGFNDSVEFFRNPNIDFLGKKWYFLAFSLVFSVAGVFSMLFWHGIPLGVDFRGGTLVYVKFSHPPDDNAIRAALEKVGLTQAQDSASGRAVTNNEVLIDLDVRETSEKALDQGKVQIINALETNAPAGKLDLNNTSSLTISQLSAGEGSAACWHRRQPALRGGGQGHRRLSRQDQGRSAEFVR